VIYFELPKFSRKKVEIIITFDREFGLRRVKIKVVRNKVSCLKGIDGIKFQKINHLLIFFFRFFPIF